MSAKPRRKAEARPAAGAVVRSRPAAVGDGKSGIEEAFAFLVKASGWPEPERELHYDWCCEHAEKAHGVDPGPAGASCSECPPTTARFHGWHRGRDFRADFAWRARALLVELQGGIYSGEAHGSISGVLKDIDRLNTATVGGWRVLRFTGAQVEDGTATEFVEKMLGIRPLR